MSQWPFRFVHAADFHLEQPLAGLSEVPDHLRDLFLDAPYRAAERVFDTVLAEEADFLVLSGDILDPQLTGPRGPLALVEQFERLAERGIPVYWAGGVVDPPDAWPAVVHLPDNVHLFPCGRPHEFVHQRDSVPLVRIVGASRGQGRAIQASDFDPDPAGLFTIAAVHELADVEAMKSRGIHYWALGGSHTRQNLFTAPWLAHSPGSHQSRRPEVGGPHGSTLVHVDPQGNARTTPMPTDVVRCYREQIQIDENTTRQDLETRLADRTKALIQSHTSVDVLISWTIAGGGPLVPQLRRAGLAGELLAALRKQFGSGSPMAWSLSLEVEPQAAFPSDWYEQQTICGDFLREMRHYQMNPSQSLELETYLSEQHQAGILGVAADLSDPAVRERVLREAALLGVDLLSGEEPQS
jgi:hypothetical protein